MFWSWTFVLVEFECCLEFLIGEWEVILSCALFYGFMVYDYTPDLGLRRIE